MASNNDFFGLSQTIPLSEAADINASTVNPSKIYKWINYTDISSVGEHSVQGPLSMPAGTAPSRARRRLQFGDIVISTVRPSRRSFFRFENQWENPICSTGFAVVSPKNESDSEYLYALLTSHAATDFYESICEGGAYPAFNGARLHEMPIPWHEICARSSIGSIAADLRNKIQVNEQIASTLEQIAQTIFKSWFVDFDPVHTKARGELPVGMDTETAALFPDSFEDSEIGPIPSGWKLGALADIVQVIDCLHSKKPELLESGSPYLQLDTITDSGVLATEKAALISDSDYTNWISRIEVTSGDCVITNVGRVGAVSQIPDKFKAAIGRNITALRPKSVNVSRTYLIELLLSRFMQKEIEFRTDSGTILDALNVKNIPSLRAVLPGDACMQKFEEVAGPLRLQMNALHAQNVALAKVRDSLLPRLISGELEIPAELLEA